jgi:hypothetical protein
MDTFVVPQNLLAQVVRLPLEDGYFGEACKVCATGHDERTVM